jgi:hypothetical protein
MTHAQPWYRWRPTPVFAIAGLLNIVGITLAQTVSWWFLLLCALGTLGPGLLRELGWLRDKDEFQRRATHRAAYHAFLITAFAAFGFYAYTRSGHVVEHAEELSMVYLALLWFVWLFSSLLSYWGARTTAFRVLIVFGCVWGVFNVLGDLTQPVTMLMQLLVTTAPFFVLAFVSRRWPRVAGVLLLALSTFFLWKYFTGFRHLLLLVKFGTVILFAGPLVASGVALLVGDGREPPSEGSIS